MTTKTKISLVIDGSGTAVFAGLLDGHDQWLAKIERNGAPLEELFPAIEEALEDSNLTLKDIGSYLYCEGPGSILGLRLCAMAIETWIRLYPESAQLYKYNSLQLTALTLLRSKPALKDALIVADWKKGAWNALYIKEGKLRPLEVIDDDELAAWEGGLYHLPQRKGWQSPPANADTLHYNPASLNRLRSDPAFLQATKGVELFNAGINSFQKWTPTRHRAQGSSQPH